MKILVVFFAFLIVFSTEVTASFAPDYKTYNWGGLDIIYVKDERLPTYSVSFYFADGALSDQKGKEGETELMFNLLTSGTRSFSQKEINDNLEYYGAKYGHSLTHEFSTYSVSGLLKDIVPTVKQICHVFNDATFPKTELTKIKKLKQNSLKNIVNNHGSVADRAFRKLSMSGTVYETPSSGTVKSIGRVRQSDLKKKLTYFKENVKKRVYIKGPSGVQKIKEILLHDCGFNLKKSNFMRKVVSPMYEDKGNSGIFLVTVPGANQAQVRIGRILNKEEINNHALLLFTSKFLGGGFTSQLMKSVRVKAGLSYSVSAFAAGQKEYGRSGITTFTKNETIGELLEVVKGTLNSVVQGDFSSDEFEQNRGYLVGSFPFSFESSSHFMESLIQLDHQGRPHDDLFGLPGKLEEITSKDVSKMTGSIFDWSKQTIVVVGPRSLQKKLRKYGTVKVLSYKSFL